jgi:hypothetical protein
LNPRLQRTVYLTGLVSRSRLDHLELRSAQSWAFLRPVPRTPCQGRGQGRLRVYMCQAAPRPAVCPSVTEVSTANLQGFRIRARGWPLLQRRRQRLACRAASISALTSDRTRAGRRRGPAGPKSGMPGGRERARLRKVPASYGQPMHRVGGRCTLRAALWHMRCQPARRALRALESRRESPHRRGG